MHKTTEQNTTTEHKNILVQYKGGGYDGCHWEWNYFCFDENGNFHDIASSGCRGIDDVEDAIHMLESEGDRYRFGRPEFYPYDLSSKNDIQEFIDESADQHVELVASKVNSIYKSNKMSWQCECCGDDQFPTVGDDGEIDFYDGKMFHTGYRGNGGIGVVYEGRLCVDCYSSQTCSHCGEHVGAHDDHDADWSSLEATEKRFTDCDLTMIREFYTEIDENHGPIDQWCMESEIESKLESLKTKGA